MKFTLSWLKEHLDTDAPLEAVCDTLTAIGLEVESVEDHAKALAPFIIAEILAADKHPDADKLRLCTVSTGKETLQVICGAPNARAGLKAVLARPGDVIPQSGQALKLSKIRGVESQGMMCAVDELGLGEETTGIIELPADAPVGGSYVKYAKLNDPVIEINLTPNRADCAGVRGVARDLAAAGLGKLKPQDIKSVKGKGPSRIKVTLDFPADQKNACPLFVGRVISNIKNGPSPAWLQQKLRAIGLRPISALVDMTNYLTFDSARPLHVFDADKVKGNLWVRPARGGESLEALNGKTYALEAGMTAIGDDTGILSLAGIVGGASTGCGENTTSVFIESAYFDPARTAKTGRALQIASDARYRFERGVDPAFVIPGAELATQLILDLCGTKETVVSELVVAGSVPDTTRIIPYDPQRCAQIIGLDVPEKEQIAILTALGFTTQKKSGKLAVTTPSWRGDVHGAEDLIEEVTRIKGFDHIPATSMPRASAVTKGALGLLEQRAGKARRALAAQGLMEAVTWSFMPGKIAAEFGQNDPALRLSNPISADLDVMRPSILGNLVQAAGRNADRGFADVGLFEVGPAYRSTSPDGQDPVAAALRAGKTPRHWAQALRAVDAFDAKADALAALAACGAPMASVQVLADAPVWYHPGRSGSLRLGPTLLGYFGELHPSLLAACGAEGPMTGCELFLAAIPAPRASGAARPLLKLDALQPVRRDFAFVVFADVTAEKLIKAVKSADKNLIRDVAVFDVYEGKGVGAGKKSVALSVTLQPAERSLTDAEIEDISSRITAAVAKATGGALRG
ncbi:MAG: phenylalanine--tRNA ligase subunit beta [Alphaproteobacteria bacterium]|nr:phenylalanine--tRNA ligase subunit beta [Alphaproteobacteria bacterium]